MDKRLYDQSIILIGPSGAGKSTVGEELHQKTGMQRMCLDRIANKARRTGFMQRFRNADEFNYYMLSEVLRDAQDKGYYGIVDFGAGHSVFDDKDIFESVRAMLKPFKNVVLLLPDADEERALEIMKNRSTGDTRYNRKFFESPCNRQLATMVVYGNGRKPSQIADEIVLRIQEREKGKEEKIH